MSEPIQDPLETAFFAAKASGLPFLSDLGPMILAAAYLGIANDTRSFARKFEQAHALVIREVSSLVREAQVLDSEDKSEKSSRVFYRLNDAGQALFEAGA
jgi:hypothetical protein